MADSIVETIIVKLGLDVSSYSNATDKAIKQSDKLNSSLGKTDDIASTVGKKLAKAFTASAILVGIANIVDQVAKLNDQMYFLEKNLGMTSEKIKGFQNAAAAMGGTADGMTGSLKSLNMAMNDFVIMGDTSMLPYMNALGVSMVDANNKVRDTDKVMLDLADSFSKMDREQAFSLASKMGIDEGTFNTLVQGRKEMEKMIEYQKTLYKSSEAELEVSRNLQKNRALLGQHWESMKTMLANALMPLFLKASEVLLGMFEYLQKNQKAVQAVFKGIAFVLTAILIPSLTKATLAALAFIAPFAPFILVVAALGAAFGLLYEDYKVWSEGGKSAFDWGAFSKLIDGAKTSTNNLGKAFRNMAEDLVKNTIPTLAGYAEIIQKLKDGDYAGAGSKAYEMISNFSDRVLGYVDTALGNEQGTAGNLVGSAVAAAVAKKDEWMGGYETKDASSSGGSSGVGSNIAKLLKYEGTMRKYLLENGQTETRTGGTVAWRNNNPGNLKFEHAGSADKTVKSKRSREKALSDARKRYEGIIDLDQWGNAIFESMEAGAVAKAKLLKSSHSGKTYPQMLRSYATNDYSGKTDYASYEAIIRRTASSMGVNLEGKKIGQMTDAEFKALAAGMVEAEGIKTGKTELSGVSSQAVSQAQQSAQPQYIPLSQLNNSNNQSRSVNVEIGDINIKTSSDTVTGNSTEGIRAAANQMFQLYPASV